MALADDQLIEQALRACDTVTLTGPRNLHFIAAVHQVNGLATSTDPTACADRVALQAVSTAVLQASGSDGASRPVMLGHTNLEGAASQFAREQLDVVAAMAVDGAWDWSLWDEAMQFVNKPELSLDRLTQTELLRWVLTMIQRAIPLVPPDRRAVLDNASELLVERLTKLRWCR